MALSTLVSDTEQWKNLKAHIDDIKKVHLRELMGDVQRCKSMMVEFDGMLLDYSRQRATLDTIDKLFKLAEAACLKQKIDRMFNGECINSTENRSVLHVALRAPKDAVIYSDERNVVPDVWQVLDKIQEFSERVRSGSWVGATEKPLQDVVVIGIGGSFSGPLFVHTALQRDPEAVEFARGRQLRFLENVDPIDADRTITGLKPETTLVVVVSKTFTTAETMLNARTLREWISSALGPQAVANHMVAVSTNLTLVEQFGIDPNNAFVFWDWVGGRYSVCSAVGVLPLSLQYGFSVVEKFLKGASSIDQHFFSAPFEENIPVLLGLLSIWNVSFLGYPARAILPYSLALEKFAPHLQQVSMESNGKGVSIDGELLPFEAGEITFGEPGTSGQHSFYQLIHQGRVIPCDFIGVVKSQQPIYLKGEVVSNHEELMSHFFAQPDALAYGKTPEELQNENVPQHLIPHKTLSGNRPSLSLLLPSLNAFNIGQLLAICEHRVAVEGFIWGINSFDQWGVELGKSLASQVRKQLNASREKGEPVEGFNYSTRTMLTRYLGGEGITHCLSDDTLLEILKRLPATKDFICAACVNRRWNRVCETVFSCPKLYTVCYSGAFHEGVDDGIDAILSKPFRPQFAVATIGKGHDPVEVHRLLIFRLGQKIPIVTSCHTGIIGNEELLWEDGDEYESVEEQDEYRIVLMVGSLPGLHVEAIPLFAREERLLGVDFCHFLVDKFLRDVGSITPYLIVEFDKGIGKNHISGQDDVPIQISESIPEKPFIAAGWGRNVQYQSRKNYHLTSDFEFTGRYRNSCCSWTKISNIMVCGVALVFARDTGSRAKKYKTKKWVPKPSPEVPKQDIDENHQLFWLREYGSVLEVGISYENGLPDARFSIVASKDPTLFLP